MYQYEYLLYGGAAGPGKSYILRWAMVELLLNWFKRYGLTGVRVGLFCEDYPTLRDRQASRIKREFPLWLGKIKDSQAEGLAFHMAPGYGDGIIALRNLDDPAKYASSEFAAIGVDELTKNQRQTFDDLRFRKRWPGIEHSPFLTASNPGSIGHGWVKKLFVDRDFSGDDENFDPSSFLFIKALPKDNPYLPKSYWNTLHSLPPDMRKAMEEGNWNIFAGQAFREFSIQKHVVEQFGFKLEDCTKVMTFDWGYNDPGCCSWLAITPENQNGIIRVYVYRELYQREKKPKQWAEELALYTKIEDIEFMVLPHDCFSTDRGNRSIAKIFKQKLNTRIIRGHTLTKNARINRAAITHELLGEADDGIPYLLFKPNCYNTIRTLPELVYDENNPEDINRKGEDHAYDALSLGLLTIKEKFKLTSGGVKSQPIRPQKQNAWQPDEKGKIKAPDFWAEFKKKKKKSTTHYVKE